LIYDGFACASHGFASQLERSWARWFRKNQWDAKYIGDLCNYADFEVEGIKIEVKPDGDEYVAQACGRGCGFLIVDGSPGYSRWWAVEEKGTANQISNPKLILDSEIIRSGAWSVPVRKTRIETIGEFLKRNHVEFKEMPF
jgi:hypothetical protein